MKRDMDLVRDILLAYEMNGHFPNFDECLKGYSTEEVEYHINLMLNAGLLEALFVPNSLNARMGIPYGYRMTWDGHDFLDAARDETRWKKAKGIMKQIGGATLEILKQILTQVMADQVKQAMGVKP